ncbi:hypothetical protein Q5752_000001 [Cryptotrichosporon argae]
MPPREKLDVASDDARKARLDMLVSLPPPGLSALDRVKAFLPQLAASNAELLARAERDPESVNVEVVPEGAAAVGMDLGLGVYDVQAPSDSAASSLASNTVVEHDDDVRARLAAMYGVSDEEDEGPEGEGGAPGLEGLVREVDTRRDDPSDDSSDSDSDTSESSEDERRRSAAEPIAPRDA